MSRRRRRRPSNARPRDESDGVIRAVEHGRCLQAKLLLARLRPQSLAQPEPILEARARASLDDHCAGSSRPRAPGVALGMRSPLCIRSLMCMRALVSRVLRRGLLPQAVGLGFCHLAAIDERRHANIRHLLDGARHAGAKRLAADRIGAAIALIVRSTILPHTVGNGCDGRKQNEEGRGDCHRRGGTISGSHVAQPCYPVFSRPSSLDIAPKDWRKSVKSRQEGLPGAPFQ